MSISSPDAERRLAYTTEEVADMLGTSRMFIYTEMQRGHLPSVKLGRARRVLHDDVMAYLAARRTA